MYNVHDVYTILCKMYKTDTTGGDFIVGLLVYKKLMWWVPMARGIPFTDAQY